MNRHKSMAVGSAFARTGRRGTGGNLPKNHRIFYRKSTIAALVLSIRQCGPRVVYFTRPIWRWWVVAAPPSRSLANTLGFGGCFSCSRNRALQIQ
jgi:hypothetical protein